MILKWREGVFIFVYYIESWRSTKNILIPIIDIPIISFLTLKIDRPIDFFVNESIIDSLMDEQSWYDSR